MKFIKVLPRFTLTFGALLTIAGTAAAEPLEQKLAALTAYRADFAQQVTDADGQLSAVSSGRLALKRPASFMLATLEPDEIYLYTRPDGVYYFDAFVNQLTIMPLSALDASPFALLLNPHGPAWQDYAIDEVKEGAVYRLTPKAGSAAAQSSGAAALKEVELTFRGSAQQYLSEVKIAFTDGSVSTYALSAQRLNAADSEFAVTIPEDAEIADER